MKKIIIIFALTFFTSLYVSAQAPHGINYQAVVRNSGGNVIASTAVGMKVTIHQGSPTGTVVYSESFTPTTSAIGLVNLVIGQGNVLSGSFSSITWSSGTFYCELGLDPAGGTSYTSMGTQQFMSVPYSLYAETSGSSGTTYTAGTGINITGTVISNTGDANAADDITNTTTAGGDLTGTYPNPALTTTGVSAGTYGSASQIPVLTIDNKGRVTSATTAANTGTSYTAGVGISIAGTTITNTGDINAADDITNTTTAGGDLTGTYPNPSLINTGVAANTYGSSTLIPVITVDSKGRITTATTVAVSAGGSGGTLDQAYNFGGPGAGRTITVNSGPVQLNTSGTNTAGLGVLLTGTGNCINVLSNNASNTYSAIQAQTNSSTQNNSAIFGSTTGASRAIVGQAEATSTADVAVRGLNLRTTAGIGVEGVGFNGVSGQANNGAGFGVYGANSSTTGLSVGTYGVGINGVYGQTTDVVNGWAGYFTADVGCEGTGYSAGGWITASDRRLKTNIVTIDNALEKICQLNGTYYTITTKTRSIDGKVTEVQAQKYGVIAQELELVFPDMVKEKAIFSNAGDQTVYKTVDYDQLIPVLIQSIKELKAQVDELKKELERK